MGYVFAFYNKWLKKKPMINRSLLIIYKLLYCLVAKFYLEIDCHKPTLLTSLISYALYDISYIISHNK